MNILKKTFLIVLFLNFSSDIFSVTRTWQGGTGVWNTGANWSGGAVPGTGDIAQFDGTSTANCTINAAVSVAGINITSAYTGTISQGANTITVGTSNAVFGGGTFTGGSTTITMNGTFTLSGTAFTSTSGNLFFNSTVTNTSGTFTHNGGNTRFSSASSQTIPAWNYSGLISSSTGARVLASSGTIGVAGAFTDGTNAYTIAGSTINFNGTGAQIIAAFNYNNLTISGSHSGNITFANAGIIGIAGTFSKTATFSSGGFVNTTSTIEYNGTGAQTVIALDYYNLVISGARGSANVTLANSDTVAVARVFAPVATAVTYVTTGSTVDYNGNMPQVIAALNYNNLVSSSSGARSLSTVGIVKVDGTFTKGSNTYTNIGSTGEGLLLAHPGTANGFLTTSSVSSSTAWATAVGGLIYKTTTGTSWTSQTSPTVQDLYGLSFNNSDDGVAAGNAGVIIRTTDGGTNWNAVTSGTAQNLRCVYHRTDSVVFVGGANGVILKSTNGGATWSATTTPGGTSTTYDITFVSVDTGYAVGWAGAILKTTNGGSNWTALTSGVSDQLTEVKFLTSNLGFVTGVNGVLLKTTDAGVNWSTVTTGTSDALDGIAFLDSNNGFLVGGNITNNTSIILRTSDGGTTWSTLWTPGWTRMTGATNVYSNTFFIAAIDGYLIRYTCCSDGGTMEFGGSSSQTIPALNYHHLTSSSSGARTLANSGTIGISGTFTKGTNTYTNTSSTIDFNGTKAQTITAFDYNNLTISGARTTTSVTLANSGTVAVAGTFSPTATFTSGAYILTSSTVSFNGAAQNIPAFTFNNLTAAGSGNKTATGALTVNAALTVNSGRTLDMSTYALSGSSLTTSGTGTLKTANVTGTPIPTGRTWTCGVEYNSASGQTIVDGTYVDLNGTGGNRTLNSSGTIGISGTFTKGAGQYTVTGSTVDFNGAAQNIPTFTFNNLTASGSGTKTATGDITVNGTLTVGSGKTLDMATSALAGTLTTSGTGTLKTQKTGSTPIATGKTWTFGVEYNSASAQTIVNGNYVDLNGTNGARTLNSTGTIAISGTFTKGAGAYTVTGSTVEFNGAAQNIPTFTFNNLTASGSGTKTATGDITVNGTLSIASGKILDMATNSLLGTVTASGTGTLKTQKTGSTPIPTGLTWTFGVEYNSASAQTIVNGNYVDLNGTNGARTLNSTGTIAVSGIFTKGAGTYTTTGSTVDFTGSTQTVPAITFNNLTISGSGDKTAGGAIGVDGILTINSGRTFSMSTNALSGSISSTSGTGTLSTTSTSATPIPAGESWTFEVSYGANSGTQTVVNGNYTNLTTAGISGTKTFSSSGTIAISGVFTKGLFVTHTVTGSTVDFNGAAQSIPTFTFNNLTVSGSGTKTATGDITVNGTLSIASGKILDMATSSLAGTVTPSGTGTLKTQKTGATPITVGRTWTFDVEFNSASAQTIVYGSFVNLTASGGDRTWSSTDTVKVSGILTPGAGTYTVTGSTVRFNGSGSQTIPACSYNNLSSSSTGARTLASSGTIGIAGIFDIGTNSYTVTGSTLDFNGGAQSIPVFTYNNLTASGSGDKTGAGAITVNGALTIASGRILNMDGHQLSGSSITSSGTGTLKTKCTSATPIPAGKTWTYAVYYYSVSGQTIVNGNYTDLDGSGGNRTLHNTGTIGISGTFTVGAGQYTITSSTVDFNGGAQSIPVFTYNNLSTSTSGTKSLAGAVAINGNLSIGASTTFSPGSYAMQLKGNYSNSGTYTYGTSIVTLNGTASQYISKSTGTETFRSLVINKATNKVYLGSPVAIVDTVRFTKGIVGASVTNYLKFNDGASAKNASDTSYVSGVVQKEGNDTFSFPLGDTVLTTGAYHPLVISAPSVVTDIFSGQYFAAAQAYGDSVQVDSLESVSDCEYWLLTRNAGSSTVTPTLGWNTNSCGIYDAYDIAVAGWNGSYWEDMGKGSATFGTGTGTVSALGGIGIPALPITIGLPKSKKPISEYVLKRNLDAGYYQLNNGYVKFKFEEEYVNNGLPLEFNIYDKNRNVVLSSSTVTLPVKYKDNRWSISIPAYAPGLAAGYYVLEVKDRKGEITKLRLKY